MNRKKLTLICLAAILTLSLSGTAFAAHGGRGGGHGGRSFNRSGGFGGHSFSRSTGGSRVSRAAVHGRREFSPGRSFSRRTGNNTVRHRVNSRQFGTNRFARPASINWLHNSTHYHYHDHGRYSRGSTHYHYHSYGRPHGALHYHYHRYYRPRHVYHYYRPWGWGWYSPWHVYYWDDWYWGLPAVSFTTGVVLGNVLANSSAPSNSDDFYYYNICAEGCRCLDKDAPTPCRCTEHCYCNKYHNK